MKTLATWSPPVAVSLLLHAALILLLSHQLPSSPERSRLQTITVELLGQMPTQASTPRVQKAPPVITEKPPAQAATSEAPTLPVAPPEAPPTAAAEPGLATASAQPALNIHPLSKLTRPPAFLHKIEPVYPRAEQRAGSQAYVLAEITIDAQGNVLEVKIMKSAGSAFDQAVMDALNKSSFVPGYIGKDAVAVRVLVPFRFNLR